MAETECKKTNYYVKPKVFFASQNSNNRTFPSFRSCLNINRPPPTKKKTLSENAQSHIPVQGTRNYTLKELIIDKVFLNCAYLVHEIFILRKLSQIIRHGFKIVLGILFDLHIKQSGCFGFQEVLQKLLLYNLTGLQSAWRTNFRISKFLVFWGETWQSKPLNVIKLDPDTISKWSFILKYKNICIV